MLDAIRIPERHPAPLHANRLSYFAFCSPLICSWHFCSWAGALRNPTINCTVNPNTTRVFRVGDFVVFNDEAADANHAGRRSYECAQIIGPGSTGEVVHTGGFQFQRAYPGVDPGYATFGTLICSHLAGTKFYKLDSKTFTYAVKKGFFRTPGLPPRVEAKIPSVCVVAPKSVRAAVRFAASTMGTRCRLRSIPASFEVRGAADTLWTCTPLAVRFSGITRSATPG